MLSLSRPAMAVSQARSLAARFPGPRTAAGWVVFLTYLGSAGLLLGFITRHASRLPFFDEYSSLAFLVTKDVPLEAYWRQHNEHRIPLPRAVYVAAVLGTGKDLRAPLYVDAVLLAAVTGFLLWAVRRARGHTSAADAFLPLTILGVGGYINLIWGFQVQFILSTVLILAFLGLVVIPGFGCSLGRLAAAGLIAVLLPLCGANGAAFVPALAAALAFIGVRNLRAGGPGLLRGVVALFGAAVGLVVVVAYFHGLKKVDLHPPPPNTVSVAIETVNFLASGAGPAVHLMYAPEYGGVAPLGWAALALVLASAVLLLRAVWDPARRDAAVAVGCALGGCLCLAGGVAYGRAGFGTILGVNRYVQLAAPVLVTAYVAWAVFARGRGRAVPFALLAVAVACWGPNTWYAFANGRDHSTRLRKVEYEIEAGIPLGFVADRNPYAFPGTVEQFRVGLELLRDHGFRPFDRIAPDPVLRAEPIPIRVLRTEGLVEEGGWYRPTGEQGCVIVALPRRQHVYGLALTYEAARPGPYRPQAVFSWDRDGRIPPAPGYLTIDPLITTAGPTTTWVFIDRETDLFRVDLFGRDTTFRLHALAVLTPAP